jgi:hypothetical protein
LYCKPNSNKPDIGYGDFSPSTTGGRLFCVIFALGGVAVLAIALGVVGHKIIESQVASLNKAETKFVDDLAKAFQKKLTKSQRQRAYAKKSNNSGSGSFSYLDDVDEVGYSIRRRAKAITKPWHNTLDFFKKFFSMLGNYLPALTPLFLGAFLIGHFEGWEWSDCIYYCVVVRCRKEEEEHLTTRHFFSYFTLYSHNLYMLAWYHYNTTYGRRRLP